ncbi:MAG: SIR2 family protein [Muribaculaceae bacterium]|nr:SIR2 family protein [Muribaculaceae bacterium]
MNYSEGVHLLWEDIINPLMKTAILRIASDKGISPEELQGLYDIFEINAKSGLDGEAGYYDVKRQVIFEYSPQIKAMLVKSILKDQYIASFQDTIYRQCNRTILREAFESDYKLKGDERYKKSGRFYTLYSVGRMILLNPHVRAVVTYNYDNFITHVIGIMQDNLQWFFNEPERSFIEERYRRMKRKRIKAIDIYGDTRPDIFEVGTIFIYHPHGYIPSPSESDSLDNCHIVMSIDEYCDSTSRVYSWDNDTQVHLLSHYTSIFMGSSISELTTQRMIRYANLNGNRNNIYNLGAHPSYMLGYSKNCNRIRSNLSMIKEQYLKECGLTNIFCAEGFNALYNDLNRITSRYVDRLFGDLHDSNPNKHRFQ